MSHNPVGCQTMASNAMFPRLHDASHFVDRAASITTPLQTISYSVNRHSPSNSENSLLRISLLWVFFGRFCNITHRRLAFVGGKILQSCLVYNFIGQQTLDVFLESIDIILIC